MMTIQVEQGRPMTVYTDILSQELSMYCTISVERVNDDHKGLTRQSYDSTTLISFHKTFQCTVPLVLKGLMMTMKVEQGRPMTVYTDILSQEHSMYCTISVERVNDDHKG